MSCMSELDIIKQNIEKEGYRFVATPSFKGAWKKNKTLFSSTDIAKMTHTEMKELLQLEQLLYQEFVYD